MEEDKCEEGDDHHPHQEEEEVLGREPRLLCIEKSVNESMFDYFRHKPISVKLSIMSACS